MDDSNQTIISQIFKTNPAIRKAFKDEVISSTATSKADCSHISDRAAKQLARDIASKSWEEDPNERISELSEYIRERLVDSGHKEFAITTVRNWIKDLAPPDCRKPGRPTTRNSNPSHQP